MLEQQFSILVCEVELVEPALRLTPLSLRYKHIIGNNRPEKDNRDGMLFITLHSLSHRATLMFLLIQRHEIVRIAVRFLARVRCHMIRLTGKTPTSRQAIRLRFGLRVTATASSHHLLQWGQTHHPLREIHRHVERLQEHAAQHKPLFLRLKHYSFPYAQGVFQTVVHIAAVQHAQTTTQRVFITPTNFDHHGGIQTVLRTRGFDLDSR